jgi:hypothetical protein
LKTNFKLRPALAGFFIAAFFLAFTWRGIFMYFTGDDVMNLYYYWSRPVWQLIRANIFFWSPYYRPFGGVIYRTFFAIFGFHPLPLYVFYFATFLLNFYLAYLVLKRIAGSAATAALATLVLSVHGRLNYLYYNTGSLYDVYCFLFFQLTLLVYLRVRERGEYLAGWSLVAFLASFVCCLNSKEMGATLPAILVLYELLFHTPRWRAVADAGGWLIREGRGPLISAICVLGYIPAKLSPQGLANSPPYITHFTWSIFFHDTQVYLGYLTYWDRPLTATGVVLFYGLLAALALLLRSRVMWFGLLFFQITLLPVSFVTARDGFVLYLPLVGFALYLAVFLTWIKDQCLKIAPHPLSESIALPLLFVLTAFTLGVIHALHWRPAPDTEFSGIRITKEQLTAMYPKLPHGSRLLFVESGLDNGFWDLLFTLRLAYRDGDLFITQLNGPREQRIPIDKLGHYDHIFTYEADHYVELDNSDASKSVRLRLVKEATPGAHIGDKMTVAAADAYKYFVKDVIMCPPKSVSCWTRDDPVLKFKLASDRDRIFVVQFTISEQTMRQTGPVMIDYYINDRLLDSVRYSEDGDHEYRHVVPAAWLATNDYTLVRIHIRNPYLAPQDGARLGVLLASAGFD